MNRALIFDVIGKAAHFRKFYTNSSSLSYYFPPKTVLAGMIAGMVGLERDSYYDLFDEKAFLAVEIRTPLRKKINVVSYLKIIGNSNKIEEFRGFSDRTQVPVEFVFPKSKSNIVYRVYFYHEDERLFNSLKSRLKGKKYIYPPYMGITELPAKIEYVGDYEIVKNENINVKVKTVLKSSYFKNIGFFEYLQRDRCPEAFNSDRTLKKVSDYIFSPNATEISFESLEKALIYDVPALNVTISFM
ncbi:type I-B CRISPR-associated protein Cas5 [Thermosipho ferrireducens]|uniref:Type I-B CRISPR-associated protein Cas5 n=1 Tax=Thermosipho ferrireducens TaxID=2571116 RepID=A0ABX7S5T5_9BACT|nr:type I-B CRISPR-associated protein Cas5b [Thermosipho ferrireducens]QTA37932.1 type I-B CRISPR-associated protein Cas5 [Thermosipho ferrireducens]